eukprot:TRINITY_DN54911_c0_g1_i2.p1 TRINITY_DN54911_c0_g1~~TRINITY_DN54911_c0_g1_i2.p1  ORF type:complete len:167 (+),score=37.57 TRINITY_DN54911_c0_g1_i2:47-547(+)
MEIEKEIVSELAYDIKQSLLDDTIEVLQIDSLNESVDEDRDGILTLWESFCIYIQMNSVDSKTIEEDFKGLCLIELENNFHSLSQYKKAALWFDTKDGRAWVHNNKQKTNLHELPISFHAIQDELFEMISKKAKMYKNETIKKYFKSNAKSYVEDYIEDINGQVYE